MIKPVMCHRPKLAACLAILALVGGWGGSSTPAVASPPEAARANFGQKLCQTAVQGGFTRLDLAQLQASAASQEAQICSCTAERYAAEGDAAHRAVLQDMQSGLLRHTSFDAYIIENIRACLPDQQEEGFGPGEAFVSHVLQCEAIVDHDASLAGYDLARLRQQMKGAGLDTQTICGCSGDYYLAHHQSILADTLAEGADEHAYDRHIVASLQRCLDLGGAQICRAVLSHAIEPKAFDYSAQTQWEKSSGLTAEDLCDCVGPRSLDLIEDRSASDLLDIVLDAIPECQFMMWHP